MSDSSDEKEKKSNKYQCDRCGSKFTRSYTLKLHKEKNKFQCKEKPKQEEDELVIDIVGEPKAYEMTPLKLKLDYSTGNVMAFIMASKSGKTTLMKHIYDNYFKNEKFISILYAMNLNSPIYKDFGSKELIKTFEFLSEVPQAQQKINKTLSNKYSFLNILDDQVSDGTKNDETLRKMVTSYRNSKMSCMISAQYINMLSKCNRSNIGYMFFGNLNTDEAIRQVIEGFVGALFNGMKLKIDEKIRIYRELTSDYKFICMNMSDNSLSFHKLKI